MTPRPGRASRSMIHVIGYICWFILGLSIDKPQVVALAHSNRIGLRGAILEKESVSHLLGEKRSRRLVDEDPTDPLPDATTTGQQHEHGGGSGHNHGHGNGEAKSSHRNHDPTTTDAQVDATTTTQQEVDPKSNQEEDEALPPPNVYPPPEGASVEPPSVHQDGGMESAGRAGDGDPPSSVEPTTTIESSRETSQEPATTSTITKEESTSTESTVATSSITDPPTDPIVNTDDEVAEIEDELEEELTHEEKVAKGLGGLGIFLAIFGMIFTAHQVAENPDGIYASVCRLAVTLSGVVLKVICMPCRKLLGGGNPHYAGHMPVRTSDYGYRETYRGTSGFEMS